MIQENENTVVIVGPPVSGKTTLSHELAQQFPDYKVYHTDDYIQHGFEDAIYKILDDIAKEPNQKVIIEGVQSARLLRKGLEKNSLFADLVIKMEVDNVHLFERYLKREGLGKSYPMGMLKSIETVYNQYVENVFRKPRIITHR